ncbi:MAG: ATP-binding protein [Acidobacteria bacterium]|nr:ATP-binding protein [Acidobacteriota bacterium]
MPETGSDIFIATIKNDLSEIERLSLIIEDFVESRNLSIKTAFEFNVALDEILTNVISYAYEDADQHLINIRGKLADGFLTIEVEDDGREFDPLKSDNPDLDSGLHERPIGGLGIHLVKKLTDQLEYRRQDGKNLLVMRKIANRQPVKTGSGKDNPVSDT